MPVKGKRGVILIREHGGRLMRKDPKKDQPVVQFFDTVDKEQFRDMLELRAGEDPPGPSNKYQVFAEFLGTRQSAQYKLPTLCRRFEVTLKQLHEMWRDYNLHQGLIEAAPLARKAIVDTARDAQSRAEVCQGCQGLGEVTGKRGVKGKCVVCQGAGVVYTPGDSKARELVFESMGLTGKRGPLVAQQFNLGAPEGADDTFTMVRGLLGTVPGAVEPGGST